MTINLPLGDGSSNYDTTEIEGNIVIIGANGSGKTRFGVRLEEINANVHRIPAQKSLRLPEDAPVQTLSKAQHSLWYGENNTRPGDISYTMRVKYQNSPSSHLQDDFHHLLSTIFAKAAERDRLHTARTKAEQKFIPVEDTTIDILQNIWNDILPHRELILEDGKVYAKSQDGEKYKGLDMSDGERVLLYLIGQCLSAPPNSLVILDEPEIHIHKSIINKVWDKIENYCQDKLLVYITHDLDFAAGRDNADKIWIKEYHGDNKWIWEIVPSDENLPETLILELLGNRKKTLFCEGESGSYDMAIYKAVYPDYHVIPRGGGDKVVESVKALINNHELHHLQAYGLIDSDYKEEAEKISHANHNIHTTEVAEIENLMCLPKVVGIIASSLHIENIDDAIQAVTKFIKESLNKEFDIQVSSKAAKLIEFRLGAFSKTSNNLAGVMQGFRNTVDNIDVNKIYDESVKLFSDAITSGDLVEILKVYNRKSLASRISVVLGLANGEYPKLFLRLLNGPQKEEIVAALKEHLPELP